MYQGTVSLSIIYIVIIYECLMVRYDIMGIIYGWIMFVSFHGFVCIIILAVVFSGQFLDPPWAYESWPQWPQWPQDYKNPPKMAKQICEFQVNHFTSYEIVFI